MPTLGNISGENPLTRPSRERAESTTQRVDAELAGLDDGTDPFAAAVRVTRMPMVITNPRVDDNPIVFANDAFCGLTGYSRGEILGRNCRFLQGPESDPDAVARIRTAIDEKEPIEIDIRNHRKDGTPFWNRLLIAPILDLDGNVEYFFASQYDTSAERARLAARTRELIETRGKLELEAAERERVEEAFRQSRKMEAVGQLTGGIAHDFNNMLQAISSSLELMQRRIEQGRAEEASQFVDGARKTVARAAALTSRLLAFARRQTLQPKPVLLDTLVEGMADLLRRTVGSDIHLQLDLRDGSWTVLCDPNQLENALLNLVINARDAMPQGGRLTIATKDLHLDGNAVAGQDGALAGDYVEISVRDDGVGMDDATKRLAFDPFFTTKPIGQGTGLGLSQIYGFVRQSRGVVTLDSAQGHGTTVHICLPRFEAAEPRLDVSQLRAEPEETRGGEVVLLVDDEAIVRATAAEQLRDLGYSVLEAEDGASAMRLLRSEAKVDVLVTDVGLPGGLNGRQIAEAARENRPALPVLFITGFAGNILREQLAPRMEVIGKPFELDTLAARLKGIMEARNTDGDEGHGTFPQPGST